MNTLSHRWYCFITAMVNDDVELMDFLLSHGCDINMVIDNNGDTLLIHLFHGCSSYGLHWSKIESMIKYVIERGADLNARDYDGKTPLHLCSDGCRIHTGIETLKLIIDNSADINVKDKYGRTPLHYASEYGRIDKAELLLKRGADINAKDRHNYTPFHYALVGKTGTEIIKLLLDYGADISTKDCILKFGVHTGMVRCGIETLQILFEHGMSVDIRTDFNDTLLYLALNKYIEVNKNVIPFLIEHGANVNATNDNNKTPLHRASHDNNVEAVKLLLENGADASIKDIKGRTPLDIAKRKKHNEIIKLLESHS